jgi:large subunit ribosomal protein L6
MSRIGNKIIPVPSGVKVQIKDGHVEVQGPKGKMTVPLPRGISFEQKDSTLVAKRDSEEHRALHGLARALVANAVTGVTTGFKKDLDIVGVGYRAEVKGKNIVLALGYSHPIEFPIPEGIQVTVEKMTHMTVTGADKNQVGQVAANLRRLRPPDPYKQKGIRITGERLKKKAGKAGAAKTAAA